MLKPLNYPIAIAHPIPLFLVADQRIGHLVTLLAVSDHQSALINWPFQTGPVQRFMKFQGISLSLTRLVWFQ